MPGRDDERSESSSHSGDEQRRACRAETLAECPSPNYQGIEIISDTAIDVGVYGNDVGSSLLWNSLGSVGGERAFQDIGRSLGLAASAVSSRFGRRVPLLDTGVGCFVAGTPTHSQAEVSRQWYAAMLAPLTLGAVIYVGREHRETRRQRRQSAFEAWYEAAVSEDWFDDPDVAWDNDRMLTFDEFCDQLFHGTDEFWEAYGRTDPVLPPERCRERSTGGKKQEARSGLEPLGASAASESSFDSFGMASSRDVSQPSVAFLDHPRTDRPAKRELPTSSAKDQRSLVNRFAPLWLGFLCSAIGLLALHRHDNAPTRPIEQVRVADRVIADAPRTALATDVARLSGLAVDWSAGELNIEGISDPLRELADEAPAETIAQADYRKLILRAQDVWPDGTVDRINIETLQPWQWIQEHQAHVGAWIPLPLDVEEMGISPGLTGKVIDILPCPKIRPGRGRIVLTTVNHLNRDVRELTLRDASGREETLRPTGTHQFYSITRGQWLPASELQSGETLDGLHGKVTVLSSRSVPGTHLVYNFTVQGEHLYRVAKAGVLVHNNCQAIGLGKTAHMMDLGNNVSLAKGRGWTRDRLTRWDSDSMEEFREAFLEATTNAKQIEFNLKGVNISKAWLAAGDMTPIVARNNGLLTEWELRQVIADRDVLNKTTFHLDGQTIKGRNFDEFYEFLLGQMK